MPVAVEQHLECEEVPGPTVDRSGQAQIHRSLRIQVMPWPGPRKLQEMRMYFYNARNLLTFYGRFSFFPGANANNLFDIGDDDLAIANVPGATLVCNNLDNVIYKIIFYYNGDHDFRQEVNGILRSTKNLLMAFLSAMAGLEVCVSATRDLSGDRLGRRGAVLVVAGLELILIWPSAQSPALIGTLDLIFGSGMQIFGALIAVLTITFWVGKPVAQRQIFGGEAKGWLRAYWWWLRWALPVMLLAVLVGYVIDSI